jgi:hypothetical protein
MRTLNEILQELTAINEYILKGVPDNDITLMLQAGSVLVTYLASTAAMVAEAGKYYSQAKTRAYNTLALSSAAHQKYYSPSLAKDYIASRCSDEGYIYEFACRMNAAVTHSLDMIRTAVSAEKQLLSNLQYGGQQ